VALAVLLHSSFAILFYPLICCVPELFSDAARLLVDVLFCVLCNLQVVVYLDSLPQRQRQCLVRRRPRQRLSLLSVDSTLVHQVS
jgi:hypothetical protein